MPSIRSSFAVLATALFALSVNSQAVYYIDPATVPLSTRTGWCASQISTCPLLCLQLPAGPSSSTVANNCDPSTLTYNCICGNGLSPNATEFSQTLPYFICTEYGSQCVAACGGDTLCQSNCRGQHPCGAQNPIRVNLTTSSSTMSATATLPAGASSGTAGVVYTGLGGSGGVATAPAAAATTSASTTQKSGSDAALDLGRSYGFVVVVAGLFAGFAMVL